VHRHVEEFVWPQYLVEHQYIEGYLEVDSLIRFFCLRPQLIEYRLKQSMPEKIARCFVTGRTYYLIQSNMSGYRHVPQDLCFSLSSL
jgi:hypothetical protein